MHQAVPGSALGIDRTACVNDACVTQAARVVNDGGFVRFGRVAGQLSVSRSLGDHHLKARGFAAGPARGGGRREGGEGVTRALCLSLLSG